MSQKEFAIRIGLTEKNITNLLKGRVQLTSNVTMRLESVLGAPAIFGENLEAIYREVLIKVEEENQMEADAEIAKNLPYSDMVKYEWSPSSKNPYEKVSNLQKFFEVSTLQLINNPAINRIACRRFSSSEKSDYALGKKIPIMIFSVLKKYIAQKQKYVRALCTFFYSML